MTHPDLVLNEDKAYYFAVLAINTVGLESAVGVSDGISASQAPVQTIDIKLSEDDIPLVGESVSISAEVDESGIQPLEYQFLVDGVLERSWNSSPDFIWTTSSTDSGLHTLKIELRSTDGHSIGSAEREIYIFRKAVQPPLP